MTGVRHVPHSMEGSRCLICTLIPGLCTTYSSSSASDPTKIFFKAHLALLYWTLDGGSRRIRVIVIALDCLTRFCRSSGPERDLHKPLICIIGVNTVSSASYHIIKFHNPIFNADIFQIHSPRSL